MPSEYCRLSLGVGFLAGVAVCTFPDLYRAIISRIAPRKPVQRRSIVSGDRSEPRPGTFSSLDLESIREKLSNFAREREWEQFHLPRSLCLAMMGEVGEVAELFQWKRDEFCKPLLPGLFILVKTDPVLSPRWKDDELHHLGEELSDVLAYLVRLADVCGVDLAAAVTAKIEKNAKKYPVHKAKGVATKYTHL